MDLSRQVPEDIPKAMYEVPQGKLQQARQKHNHADLLVVVGGFDHVDVNDGEHADPVDGEVGLGKSEAYHRRYYNGDEPCTKERALPVD